MMKHLRNSKLIFPFSGFRKSKQVPRFYLLDRFSFDVLVVIVTQGDFEAVVQTFPNFGVDYGEIRK
jgi:hypothetical protein